LVAAAAASDMGENTQELADHGLYCSHPRKLLSCSFFVLFTLSLIYFIFYSSPSSFASYADLFDKFKTQGAAKNISSLPPPPQGNYSLFFFQNV